MSKQSYTKMQVLLRMGGYLPLPESLENIHCVYCVSMFAFSLPFTNTVVRPQNSVPLLDLLSSRPTVNQSIPTKYSGMMVNFNPQSCGNVRECVYVCIYIINILHVFLLALN